MSSSYIILSPWSLHDPALLYLRVPLSLSTGKRRPERNQVELWQSLSCGTVIRPRTVRYLFIISKLGHTGEISGSHSGEYEGVFWIHDDRGSKHH
jgi:hypothetical protein